MQPGYTGYIYMYTYIYVYVYITRYYILYLDLSQTAAQTYELKTFSLGAGEGRTCFCFYDKDLHTV